MKTKVSYIHCTPTTDGKLSVSFVRDHLRDHTTVPMSASMTRLRNALFNLRYAGIRVDVDPAISGGFFAFIHQKEINHD